MRRNDPDGRPLPPAAHVFGDEIGRRVGSIRRAWQTAVLRAHGHKPVWIWKRKDGPKDKGNTSSEPGIRSGLSCHRSAFPRSAARRRLALTRRRLAGASRPAHARPCVPSTDQHIPQRDAARTPRIGAQPGGIARGLQVPCKQPLPRSTAHSQGSSRLRRELIDSLRLGFGGVDGTRATSPRPKVLAGCLRTARKPFTRSVNGGVNGTRTRGLRRDRRKR